MTRQHNKKNTHKRTHKRTHRIRRLIPNSNDSIFSAPEKIVIDTEHNKSGNIIPGLRTYLGNV